MFTAMRGGPFGKSAPTQLLAIDPTSGNTVLRASIPLALTGMTFDTAPTPGFKVKGAKVIRTTKTTHTLKGL